MGKELKSFWTGALQGAAAGAWKGFLIGGTLLLGAALIAGTAITPNVGIFFMDAFAQIALKFFIGGMIGAVPGAAIGAVYEGVSDYVEQAEIQKEVEHMKELERKTHLPLIAKEQQIAATADALQDIPEETAITPRQPPAATATRIPPPAASAVERAQANRAAAATTSQAI